VNPAAAPRLGFPIIASREFRSHLVIVVVREANALETLGQFHASVLSAHPGDLIVDDQDPEHPVYFFDVPYPGALISDARYRLVMTVFAIDGADHPLLPLLCARSHAFCVAGTDEAQIARAREQITSVLREDQWAKIHEARLGPTQSASDVFHTIASELSELARSQPSSLR
jgi:hypothetical protein